VKTDKRNVGRGNGGRGTARPTASLFVGMIEDLEVEGRMDNRWVISCARTCERERVRGSYVGARTVLS
jgi:hypothetical protein